MPECRSERCTREIDLSISAKPEWAEMGTVPHNVEKICRDEDGYVYIHTGDGE